HDAEADARAAVDCLSEPTWPRVGAIACLTEVLVERGALDEARALLEPGPGVAHTDGGAPFFLYVPSLLREAAAPVEGALGAALAWRRTIEPDPDFDGWLRIARLRHARGDGEGAGREAAAALRWARAWGTPAHIGQALAVAGLVGGDLAQLAEAVGQL